MLACEESSVHQMPPVASDRFGVQSNAMSEEWSHTTSTPCARDVKLILTPPTVCSNLATLWHNATEKAVFLPSNDDEQKANATAREHELD
jgi:hypothetical protein